MKTTKLETWAVARNKELFDKTRQGEAPMNWDVMVLRLHTDAGIVGEATALAARSWRTTNSGGSTAT